jgi:hypothetical protein
MAEKAALDYLQWQALVILYRNRERASSPVRYVGLATTVTNLIKHHPPLAQWVGSPSNNQVHITPAGIALYESSGAPGVDEGTLSNK